MLPKLRFSNNEERRVDQDCKGGRTDMIWQLTEWEDGVEEPGGYIWIDDAIIHS